MESTKKEKLTALQERSLIRLFNVNMSAGEYPDLLATFSYLQQAYITHAARDGHNPLAESHAVSIQTLYYILTVPIGPYAPHELPTGGKLDLTREEAQSLVGWMNSIITDEDGLYAEILSTFAYLMQVYATTEHSTLNTKYEVYIRMIYDIITVPLTNPQPWDFGLPSPD